MAFDDQVRLIVADEDAAVEKGNLDLTVESQALMSQFDTGRVLVGAFEPSGTEIAMDFDRAANDAFRERVMFMHGSGRSMRLAARFGPVCGRPAENVANTSMSMTFGCCKNSSVSSLSSVVTVRRQALTLLALLVCWSCKSAESPTTPTPTFSGPTVRVLMLTATAGFRHDAIATAREVLGSIGTANGIATTATEDLSQFTSTNLANFDVVMFCLTSGELPFTTAQRSALIDFVNGGKGFVGIHSATDTLYEWPDYGRLVGAYFREHPWTQQGRVVVEEPSHPAAGVRDAFTLEEEFYTFRDNPRGRVQVLMRLDAASVGATGDYPLVWAQSFGSGRAYYNALGHFPTTWRDSRFQAQLIAAFRWTGSR